MRSVRFLFRCLKDGIIVSLGGDSPQRSGITGILIWFAYFLVVGFVIVGRRNNELCADQTGRLLLAATVIYFLILLAVALLIDLIRHVFSGK